MASVTRVPTDGQVCRHSKEAFDALFAVVTVRDDLTLSARAVHAACVSLHRLGKLGSVTQREIAEWANVSRRSVVRAFAQLVRAGFLLVRRRGQGLPNAVDLVGIDQAALDGRSAKPSRPALPERRANQPYTYKSEEKEAKNRTTGSGYGDFPYGSRAAWVSRYGPLTMG
jgi:hypothetical protein